MEGRGDCGGGGDVGGGGARIAREGLERGSCSMQQQQQQAFVMGPVSRFTALYFDEKEISVDGCSEISASASASASGSTGEGSVSGLSIGSGEDVGRGNVATTRRARGELDDGVGVGLEGRRRGLRTAMEPRMSGRGQLASRAELESVVRETRLLMRRQRVADKVGSVVCVTR